MKAMLTKIEFEATLTLGYLEILVLQHYASYGGEWMHKNLSSRFDPETIDEVMNGLRKTLGEVLEDGAASARTVRAS